MSSKEVLVARKQDFDLVKERKEVTPIRMIIYHSKIAKSNNNGIKIRPLHEKD